MQMTEAQAAIAAEKYLQAIVDRQDFAELREMNGEKCASRQIAKLRCYERSGLQKRNLPMMVSRRSRRANFRNQANLANGQTQSI